MEPIFKTETEYSNLFKISLILKSFNAMFDILGGVFMWFASKIFLITFILNFFKNEITDDPHNIVGKFIVDSAATLSVSSQYFISIYLLIHGAVKIFLLINLFKKRLWAYPLSIFVFSALIIYQIYELYISFSVWVFLFTSFDTLMVLLVIHEYGVLKIKHKKLNN